MMTDGTEAREFLYAEDCCEALETVMGNYDRLNSDDELHITCLLYTSPSPRDVEESRMPSSA